MWGPTVGGEGGRMLCLCGRDGEISARQEKSRSKAAQQQGAQLGSGVADGLGART